MIQGRATVVVVSVVAGLAALDLAFVFFASTSSALRCAQRHASPASHAPRRNLKQCMSRTLLLLRLLGSVCEFCCAPHSSTGCHPALAPRTLPKKETTWNLTQGSDDANCLGLSSWNQRFLTRLSPGCSSGLAFGLSVWCHLRSRLFCLQCFVRSFPLLLILFDFGAPDVAGAAIEVFPSHRPSLAVSRASRSARFSFAPAFG